MNQTDNYRRAYEKIQQQRHKKYFDVVNIIAGAKDVADIREYCNKTGCSYVESLEGWISGVHFMCQYALQRS